MHFFALIAVIRRYTKKTTFLAQCEECKDLLNTNCSAWSTPFPQWMARSSFHSKVEYHTFLGIKSIHSKEKYKAFVLNFLYTYKTLDWVKLDTIECCIGEAEASRKAYITLLGIELQHSTKKTIPNMRFMLLRRCIYVNKTTKETQIFTLFTTIILGINYIYPSHRKTKSKVFAAIWCLFWDIWVVLCICFTFG